MSGIGQPLRDVMTQLTTLQVLNLDNQTVPLYVRVFNNQPKKLKEGKIQAYPLPAAFVEIVKPAKYTRLLNGASESDLIWRIHLQHWFTDTQDGTMEQDLLIFDQMRDPTIACLSNFKPTACGNMMLVHDGQDFNHDDIYVYLVEFTSSFIDSKGSPYDPAAGKYINSTPPLALDLIVNLSETLSYPDFALGYYIVFNTDEFWDNDTLTFTAPHLKGKTGYAIYAMQLSQFLSPVPDVDVHYDADAGSFSILVPGFELIDGYGLIVFGNKYDEQLP